MSWKDHRHPIPGLVVQIKLFTFSLINKHDKFLILSFASQNIFYNCYRNCGDQQVT